MTMRQPSLPVTRALRALLHCLPRALLLASLLALLPSLLLAGCADLQDGVGSSRHSAAHTGQTAAGSREAVRTAAASLVDGIRLYESGRFQEAIAAFDTPAMRAAPGDMRVEALKYTAFSYCVTESYAQCRHAFDLLLGIDADFELRRSERGHPMWGPVFEQAKAVSDQDRDHASADRDRERWRGIDLWRAR